jgi:hypothetical protein
MAAMKLVAFRPNVEHGSASAQAGEATDIPPAAKEEELEPTDTRSLREKQANISCPNSERDPSVS